MLAMGKMGIRVDVLDQEDSGEGPASPPRSLSRTPQFGARSTRKVGFADTRPCNMEGLRDGSRHTGRKQRIGG